VAVLIMLVPVVPWGLREAAATTGAIYLMFTASTYLGRYRFAALDLWVLQCLMLVAAVISLALVARALQLRKHDLALRFHLEQAQRELIELANRDHLTGAWNRRHIERDFEHALARHRALGADSWFALFDIDRFKAINDTHGHDVGDDVIRMFASRVQAVVREADFVARLGGDEFVLIAEGLQGAAAAAVIAQKIIGAMVPPFQLGTATLQVTTSIGIAAFEAGRTARTLIRAADQAMYDAKRAGRNCFRIAPADADRSAA
jgi:diguanylate cyclase (GGDEF)-like protein